MWGARSKSERERERLRGDHRTVLLLIRGDVL